MKTAAVLGSYTYQAHQEDLRSIPGHQWMAQVDPNIRVAQRPQLATPSPQFLVLFHRCLESQEVASATAVDLLKVLISRNDRRKVSPAMVQIMGTCITILAIIMDHMIH